MAQSYNYRARNQHNAIVTGVVQATTLDAAKKVLMKNGLTPLTLTPPKTLSDYLPFIGKVNHKDRAFFARQISTMIEAGLTLSQALHLLINQTKPGTFRQIMEGVQNDIQEGFSFSAALAKYPDVFDPIFLNVVRSGEATGKLEIVLAELSTTMEKDVKLRSKVKGALMYPAFILCAMFAVGMVMMIFVVPKLTSMFTDAKIELPMSTKALIFISWFLSTYWYVVIIGIAALFFGLRAFLRTDTGMDLYSQVALKIPVVDVITEQSNMARFGRMLGLLLGSGVPLLEAMRLINESFTNRLYRRGIAKVALDVEKGVPMSVPISENPIFPIMVGQMVAVGEQTGRMDEVMGRLADYYENEVETKVGGITTLIEPFIILILGAGVAWLVMAILLPIYQLTTSIS